MNNITASTQGDTISRSALEKDFRTRLENAKRWKENAINRGDDEIVIRATATIDFICEVIMTINNAPTVEPSQNAEHDATQYSTGYQDGFLEAKKLFTERPQGEWLENVFIGGYICNNCNAGYNTNPKSPFCPICGAWMKNGQIPKAVARRAIKTKKDGQADE